LRNTGVRGFDSPYYAVLHTGYKISVDWKFKEKCIGIGI